MKEKIMKAFNDENTSVLNFSGFQTNLYMKSYYLSFQDVFPLNVSEVFEIIRKTSWIWYIKNVINFLTNFQTTTNC
jgi:hypothetical protein